MKFSQANPFIKLLLTAGALSLTVVSVTGCGMFGQSWDVKLEVTGDGSADVGYAFPGDNDGQTDADRKLPWNKAQNVGFGFSEVAVADAGPGTACRIYVNGKLKDEQRKPDAKGLVSCSVNLQD
ncbi:MmpS family transport accessory protein [Streptomyces sp. NBC_01716]|uniref:MmpS family transport accessory protein n=1 Tax=Streptomyces sp. NBC_01716 TaxID=2975917 RepID=UPI002E37FEE6|nr:MmpS family transport accessory protein [Streptomyces sp. NBC_01716]